MQIRITDTNTPRTGTATRGRTGKTGAARPAAERSPFLQVLDDILAPQEAGNTELHELWSRLPETERDMLDNPSEKNFVTYRELVRNIARETLRKNVQVVKKERRSKHGETVELRYIKIIDQRLQQMALMIQSPSNSAFAMLRAAEEIRGMLLDSRE